MDVVNAATVVSPWNYSTIKEIVELRDCIQIALHKALLQD